MSMCRCCWGHMGIPRIGEVRWGDGRASALEERVRSLNYYDARGTKGSR